MNPILQDISIALGLLVALLLDEAAGEEQRGCHGTDDHRDGASMCGAGPHSHPPMIVQ